jgi:hypothetical protein
VDEYILLIDEGQTTYAELGLWNVFFKQIHTQPGKRIAIFCSYGSPGRRAISNAVYTPQIVEKSARISLLPDSTETRPPVGLLFTDIEYNEAIRAFRHDSRPVRMDAALKEYLLNLTSGHPGAVMTLLRICAIHKPKPREWELTLDEFKGILPPNVLFPALRDQLFTRGLPARADMQNIPYAIFFKRLVLEGSIPNDPDDKIIEDCVHNGWVHVDSVDDIDQLVFASQLHQLYLAWSLFPPSAITVDDLPYPTVLDFVKAALRLFNPNQLSQPKRKAGPAFSKRVPESQYQQELYRSIHILTKGKLWPSPEFGSAPDARLGRIDLFIPVKCWGIELTRDGSKLAEHASRFDSDGAYAQMADITSHIILDFRTNMPIRRHSALNMLYHVVFTEEYQQVTILSNELSVLDFFHLIPGGMSI